MKTSKELIELISNTVFNSGQTEVTLPNGNVYTTDMGYVNEFWKAFLKALDRDYFE